jgi:hypothetical protein
VSFCGWERYGRCRVPGISYPAVGGVNAVGGDVFPDVVQVESCIGAEIVAAHAHFFRRSSDLRRSRERASSGSTGSPRFVELAQLGGACAHSDDVYQSFRSEADQIGAKRRRDVSVWNRDRYPSRVLLGFFVLMQGKCPLSGCPCFLALTEVAHRATGVSVRLGCFAATPLRGFDAGMDCAQRLTRTYRPWNRSAMVPSKRSSTCTLALRIPTRMSWRSI